jgi:flavin reductase (DIM6/NTAB) family NADH-FMN oxidoreductase RutF
VDKRSNTLPALQHSKAFVVNFLSAGRDELSNRFASKEPDKFRDVEWRASEVAKGAPILHQDVVAYAECVVDQEIDAGDHYVYIGLMEGGETLEGVSPLTYFRRVYGAWPVE